MNCTIPIACLVLGLALSPSAVSQSDTNERVCVDVGGSTPFTGAEYGFYVALSRISDPRNEWDPEKSDFPGDLDGLVAEAQRTFLNSGTIIPPVRLSSLRITRVGLVPHAYSPRVGPVPPNRWCVVMIFGCQNESELTPGQNVIVMLPDGAIAERLQLKEPAGAPAEPRKVSEP